MIPIFVADELIANVATVEEALFVALLYHVCEHNGDNFHQRYQRYLSVR